jgi:putative membrane protein
MLNLSTKLLIAIIAAEHLYFMYLEMFAWTTRARKVFKGFPPDFFEKTRVLAANQGLYNGFLAAGLLWSLTIKDAAWSSTIAGFFLACVSVAGIYGAYSVQKTIFYIQALPAFVGLLLLLFIR